MVEELDAKGCLRKNRRGVLKSGSRREYIKIIRSIWKLLPLLDELVSDAIEG